MNEDTSFKNERKALIFMLNEHFVQLKSCVRVRNSPFSDAWLDIVVDDPLLNADGLHSQRLRLWSVIHSVARELKIEVTTNNIGSIIIITGRTKSS